MWENMQKVCIKIENPQKKAHKNGGKNTEKRAKKSLKNEVSIFFNKKTRNRGVMDEKALI